MKKLVSLCLMAALGFSTTGMAQEALITQKTLSFETGLKLAQQALVSCRESGFHVSVVIVDVSGRVNIVLRDSYASAATVDVAILKAKTAANFHMSTELFSQITAPGTPGAPLRDVPGVIALGGGMMVEAAGSMVGAIGVAGAPGGDLDDICAQAGLDEVLEDLEF